jgi:hypothetical protein
VGSHALGAPSWYNPWQCLHCQPYISHLRGCRFFW